MADIDKHLGNLLDTLITMAIRSGRCHSDQKYYQQGKELEQKCYELKNDIIKLVVGDHTEMETYKKEMTEWLKTSYDVDQEQAKGVEKLVIGGKK